jgi:micrococcal nuclease
MSWPVHRTSAVSPFFAVLALAAMLTASAPLRPLPSPAPSRPTEAAAGSAAAPPTARIRPYIPAELVRVIDGDTVEMRALIWLDQQVTTRVRLRGIDAPERDARCPEEARRADAATEGLRRLVAGRALFLTDIGRDKYGGRVVARIVSAEGADIGEAMLRDGHARIYARGRRETWCG